MSATPLYPDDVVGWAEQQAEALRCLARVAPSNAVDWANVIEEIGTLGRSEWRAVRSQLVNALDHIVRGLADPSSLSPEAWAAEVGTVLTEAQFDCRPSMAPHLAMDDIWRHAVRRAGRTLGAYKVSLPPGLPVPSPVRLEDLLDPTFDYDRGRTIVRAAMLSKEKTRD